AGQKHKQYRDYSKQACCKIRNFHHSLPPKKVLKRTRFSTVDRVRRSRTMPPSNRSCRDQRDVPNKRKKSSRGRLKRPLLTGSRERSSPKNPSKRREKLYEVSERLSIRSLAIRREH